MKRIFSAFVLPSILCLLVLSSCQYQQSDNIRIVSSDGTPVKLERKTPLFNAQQLEKQRDFKEENGGITLIDEAGPKAFNSRGNNYAYAEKQDSFPDKIFEDKLENNGRQIVNKDANEVQKATIKTQNGVINGKSQDISDSQEVKSEDAGQIEAKNGDERGVSYLFPGDKTSSSMKDQSHQTNNKAINLNNENGASSKTSNNNSSVSGTSSAQGNYYLQLGAFKSKKGAETMLNNYKRISSGEIKTVTINNQKVYRVVLGPYNSKSTAESNKEKVIKTGHYDVFITKR
jgi:cell division protein FtsN